MEKRGSHVGIILSFAMFVVFLVFLYSITEPAIKTQTDKEFLLGYLKGGVLERSSAEMTGTTILSSGGWEDKYNCLEINYSLMGIENPTNISLVAYNETNPLSSNFDGGYLYIGGFSDKKQFFKIYYSEEPLDNNAEVIGSCTQIVKEDEYTIGLIRTTKYIFESRIIELINDYESDYESIKEELKVPIGSEFDFSFRYSNGTTIGTGEKSITTSIYAEETPIQYIDKQASINSGFINIRIW